MGRMTGRICWAALILLSTSLSAQPFRSRMGIEIDGFGDASRARPFVDHGRLFRPCTELGGSARVAVDADGWPARDASCVLFDVRPIFAWAPPIDDPDEFQPDWSGTWNVSWEGQAAVEVSSGGGRFEGLTYDAATNVTRGQLIVNRGTGLIIVSFRNTRRAPGAEPNTGWRNFRLIRPGYAAGSGQIYTEEFLRGFRPFQTLRYMDFTATNDVTPSPQATRLLEWNERHLITDATQQSWGGRTGVAWEFAVLLANQTGTDLWINIPVSASENYVRQLARLVVRNLNPGLKIYLEHGNEVWNPLFANSYNFNRNAAVAEVSAGNSNLSSDGQTATDVVGRRRHLRRVIDAVRLFREAQAEAGLPADPENDPDRWRIRGVYAWWTIQPVQYRTTLDWAKSVFGDLNKLIYAIASTHYYNVSRATATDSPERLVEVMRASSDAGVSFDDQYRAIAREFGLRHTIYEGGPDVGGGSTVNIGNRIRANRLPGMKDLVQHDMKNNWFDRGGAEYMYFAHCGPCSRFGCWGALEDIATPDTPKMNALRELSGAAGAAPTVTAIVNAGSFSPRVSAGSFVTLTGTGFTALTQTWSEAILPGSRALPTMLGGLQVLFHGRPGAIYFARADQVNVIVPPDLPAGPAPVEVTTPQGTWRGSVTLDAAAPGWFGYVRDGRFNPAALFSGTTIYVAPAGSLPGVASRAARAGDILELYATGLGATASPVPVNEAPDRAYPVADLSRVRVSVGGRAADVLFAGVTLAGVYQVNIRVPAGVAAGDAELTLTVGDAAAQAAVLAVGN
jgi:uncharacterized protein (TIGR03437 family)